jgi:hypothetical protein
MADLAIAVGIVACGLAAFVAIFASIEVGVPAILRVIGRRR